MTNTRTPLPELVRDYLRPVETTRHVLTAQMFTPELLELLFDTAIQRGYDVLSSRRHHRIGTRLQGHRLYRLFEAESTRTYESFGAAAEFQGMSISGIQGSAKPKKKTQGAEDEVEETGIQLSSEAKGESRRDTILTMNTMLYSVLVYRSKEEGKVAEAARVSRAPIINAGDGSGEHPSQALLDALTIKLEMGRIEGQRIAIVGDNWHSRVARSDVLLLSQFDDVSFDFIAPEPFQMRTDILEALERRGVPYRVHTKMRPAISKVDVVMMLRLQRERATQQQIAYLDSHPDVFDEFSIGPADDTLMLAHAKVMHPLPRLQEISVAFDGSPKAAYIRQMFYGVIARMALLEWVLGYQD